MDELKITCRQNKKVADRSEIPALKINCNVKQKPEQTAIQEEVHEDYVYREVPSIQAIDPLPELNLKPEETVQESVCMDDTPPLIKESKENTKMLKETCCNAHDVQPIDDECMDLICTLEEKCKTLMVIHEGAAMIGTGCMEYTKCKTHTHTIKKYYR